MYLPSWVLRIESYSLFEDEDDFVLVVEDVSEVDDLVGVVADGEHGDLVQDVHGAVAQRAVGAGPAGRACRRLSYFREHV